MNFRVSNTKGLSHLTPKDHDLIKIESRLHEDAPHKFKLFLSNEFGGFLFIKCQQTLNLYHLILKEGMTLNLKKFKVTSPK